MHRLRNVNSKCNLCSLSTGTSVFGQSVSEFKKVALVVISSYPGRNEEETGLSLSPDVRKRVKFDDMGAGSYLRLCLNNLFSEEKSLPKNVRNIEEYTFFTNAIKCAKRNSSVLRRHRVTCRDAWLLPELNLLPPTVPILIAGSDPLKALLGEDKKVSDSRGKIFYFNKHPIVVTFNPIEAERGLLKTFQNDLEQVQEDLNKYFELIKNKKPNKKIVDEITKVKFWKPLLPGTINWFFKADLELVKTEVIKYVNSYEQQYFS